MRIIHPDELFQVLDKEDTIALFLSADYWEPLPHCEAEADAVMASYLTFKKGEALHLDNQEWAAHAHRGWLIATNSLTLRLLGSLPKVKREPKIGALLQAIHTPDPHTRPLELISRYPAIEWAVAHRQVWVPFGYGTGYVDIEQVGDLGITDTPTILLHSGVALSFSPRGGVRPYRLYTFHHHNNPLPIP